MTKAQEKTMRKIEELQAQDRYGIAWVPTVDRAVKRGELSRRILNSLFGRGLLETGSTGICDFVAITCDGRDALEGR